jgi:hypothetical protein
MTPNERKAKQLGMPYGTASAKLRKSILWYYITKCGDNICYQCQKPILTIEELSIEHKEPWLDKENVLELYFGLDNIAFSHLLCNIGAARKPTKIHETIQKGKNASFMKTWRNKPKEEQQKRRRENYLKYGC